MRLITVVVIALMCSVGYAQEIRTIQTAASTLYLTTNGASAGLGEVTVVGNADNGLLGLVTNPSLLAHNEHKVGGAFFYTPWIGNTLGINPLFFTLSSQYLYQASVAGTMRIDSLSSFGVRLTRFNFGLIQFTDENGQDLQVFTPTEQYIQFSYGRKLGEKNSVGVSLKPFSSNLSGYQAIAGGGSTTPVRSVAFSLGWNHRNAVSIDDENTWSYEIGAAVDNLGPKVTYLEGGDQKDFIPMNILAGGKLGIIFSEKYTLSFCYQMQKLLVPSPPVYDGWDQNGVPVIVAGQDPNRSVVNALFTSWNDAPDGMSEEWKEVSHQIGLEVSAELQEDLSLFGRIGRFSEHQLKGGRKFTTFGGGLRAAGFILDGAFYYNPNSLLNNVWKVELGYFLK